MEEQFKRPTEKEVINKAYNTWSTLAWQAYPSYEEYIREVLREFQCTEAMSNEDYQKYRVWRRENLLTDIGEFMKLFKVEGKGVTFEGKK